MIEFQRLSDVADLTVGYVGTMGKEYTKSGVKFLRSLNIKPFSFDFSDIKHIPEEFNNKLKKSELHTNDVVIVRTGVPGTCAVIPPELDGCNCADLVIVKPDTTLIDPYYLCAFINSWGRAQVSNVKVGAIQKHFNVTSAEEMLIPIVDMSAQKTIAKILKNLNDKIFNNNSICANLEAMAKLLYDYWFVQFDFPDENGKPYKSSGGKMVWNDELKREIPEGWEVRPLGDIIAESSKSIVQVNGAKADGIYPFFTSGSAILAYDQYFVDGFHCFLNTGGNPDIKGYKGKCAYSTDTWCIDAGKYSYFMYQYFMLIRSQFEQLFFAGSGLKHLQKDALKKQCVVLPSDEVIGEFNVFLDDLWDKRTACFLENQQLASLRDFLLPMLMNGQVKVKGDS